MPVIEVKRLTKFYGKSLGIENVNLSVNQGEIFGFLGANGAGKTTTIRLLMDLLRPNHGEIFIFDKPLTLNHVELKDRIGYLPGEFRPYLEMTGINFLKYMASYRSNQPVLREQLFKQFKLTQSELSKKIKYLSHGTRQKIGIALAFEHNPDLAILDEPTLGLDPLIQESFYEMLLDFQTKGKTVFLSSHILREIEKICQRVAIIRNGHIVALESIEALKENRPRRLILEFKNIEQIDPRQIPGLGFLEQRGNRYFYYIKGEIRSVLTSLSQMKIEDIIFPEPELEDVFLTYYSEKKND